MAAASATLPAVLLVIVVFPAVHGASSAGAAKTALDQVCGGLGGFYVTPGLCASALCADDAAEPCRDARDAPAVAALAARLAARNATAARDSVQAALASRGGANATSGEQAVRSCLQLYDGAVPALRWAARSVAAGRYRGAREVLQAAQYVAAGCEGMAGGAAAAALPRENGAFSDMAFVAHAVVASVVATD